jgi:hypothetical protein
VYDSGLRPPCTSPTAYAKGLGGLLT